MGKNLPANVGDSLIPGSGRFPGEGHGNPLHDLSLENPWTEEADTLKSTESQRVRPH